MNYDEILPFADEIIYSNQITIITLKNGVRYSGFYDSSKQPNGQTDKITKEQTDKMTKNNEWSFTVFGFEKNNNETIIIKGDDILNIEITKIRVQHIITGITGTVISLPHQNEEGMMIVKCDSISKMSKSDSKDTLVDVEHNFIRLTN